MSGPFDRIAPSLERLAVPIAALAEDPRNVRVHDERNLRAIASSLDAHGQLKPIVVRKEGMVVVAGNGTLAAARDVLGWKRIAASVVDMDERQAAAFAIADNRTAELATWDDDALSTLVEELAGAESFDPGELGMTPDEVQRIRQGILFDLPEGAEGKPLDPDALEKEVKTATCPGCGKEFPV